jgi:hypothetical protein
LQHPDPSNPATIRANIGSSNMHDIVHSPPHRWLWRVEWTALDDTRSVRTRLFFPFKRPGIFFLLILCFLIVRVYLVGYIFCIIDYYICRNIFDRIDIMYYKLSYVSRNVFPLKNPAALYIYLHQAIQLSNFRWHTSL